MEDNNDLGNVMLLSQARVDTLIIKLEMEWRNEIEPPGVFRIVWTAITTIS
jgi:hypothetical protein